MKYILTLAAIAAATVAHAVPGGGFGGEPPVVVPEIDALAGVAALAAVAGVVALVRERSKR